MMTTEKTETRIALDELMRERGIDAETADRVLDGMTAETHEQMLATLRAVDVEKQQLRERIAATPIIGQALCPRRDWKTADDRYDCTKRALALTAAYAEKHGTTVEALCAALVDGHGTIADQIEMHGDDPRTTLWGTSFYAMRFRLADAVTVACADRLRAERETREAARDAAWTARGLVRCDRCGGAGGAKHWPGFTCYDCDGIGATPREH